MTVFDILKTAATIAKESGKLELQGEILGVYEKLLEQQKRISDLESENKDMKEKLKIQEDLVFGNNAYWIEKDTKKEGPYCSCCWDNDKKPIRMQPCGNPAYFDCPKCANKGIEIYPERSNPPQASRLVPRINSSR
jgi:hypothetical protein